MSHKQPFVSHGNSHFEECLLVLKLNISFSGFMTKKSYIYFIITKSEKKYFE